MSPSRIRDALSRAIALLFCSGFLFAAMPAGAGVVAEPMPAGERGQCELTTFTPRQVTELIYENVVHTSQQSLDAMGRHIAPDIVFRDPVTSTKGWPAYRKVYEQFISADQLYYRILDWSCSGRTVYIAWVFGMRNEHTSNQYVEFEGVSKLVLDQQDRIVLDLDSWNEVPPGYAGALRSGDKGGVKLE